MINAVFRYCWFVGLCQSYMSIVLFDSELYGTFKTWQKFEIKNSSPLGGGNCKTHSTIRKTPHQETKLLTSLTFLLCCRDHNTIPHFLQFHHHIHSWAANTIYQCTSFALLRERIHHNRRELDNTNQELLEVNLRLASVLSKSDWSPMDQLTFNTLRTGDTDLRFYITTLQDEWRKSAFLTRASFPCTIHLIMQYIEPVSEWSSWRMFIETWPHSELTFRHRGPLYRDRRLATLQRTLFIYLINKYISLSDICLMVHHWYK